MAHFHKLPGSERISGQTIPVTSNSFTVGLWGYRDFSNRELTVVSSISGVTAEAKRVIGQSREWLITARVCGNARIEARTVDGQVWDWIQLNFVARSAMVDQQRRAVIAEAQRYVGAHYVWGAAGACPGQQNGMAGREGAVNRVTDRLDPRNPCIRAASCSVDGYHVCAGKYQEVSGRVLQPNDPALVQYLDRLRTQPPEQWQPMEGALWPRMMEGKTVTKQIVLGESCQGVRHFDCVGFINYCLAAVLHRRVQDSIDGWIRNTATITDRSDQPGDILTIGNHHIGFSMGDGRAIHASQTSRGVVIDPLGTGGWDRRGRYLR